jgi:two-component system NarL family sensor kinase
MSIFHKALIVGFSLVIVVARGQQSDARYDSALHYFEAGQLQRARMILEHDVAVLSPARAANYFALLGTVLEDQGYVLSAKDAYTKSQNHTYQESNRSIAAKAINGIARTEIALGNYDSIPQFLKQSRALDASATNAIAVDQVEGKYWQAQNQYDQALASLQRAFDVASQTDDKSSMATILSSMGSINLSHNPDPNVALGFYERSNALGDTLKPSVTLIRTYCRMANAYMVSGNLPKARHHLDRAAAWTRNSDYLSLRAYVLSTQVILLAEQGQYAQAAAFSEEPMRIKRELGDNRQLQTDLLNVAELRMKIGEYDKAEKLLAEGTAIGHRLHDLVFLKYFYNRRSQLDSIRGNYLSAYENLKKSFLYKDSTFSVDHLRAVNEIREKYEAGQKEKIIAEKELQIEAQKYQRAIILGVSSSVVLILIAVLILIRSTNRTKLQHEKQARLRTIVQTQEDVQQRIARDLHDGLVQVLGAAQISLESVSENSDTATLKKQMNVASGILEEALTEARSISHQILPYSLLKGGLNEALEELLSRSFDDYTFRADPLNLTEGESINVYRIVQELVNNVRKHAEATRVSLIITVKANEVRLVFEDDGRGFSLADDTNGGVGLSNMSARAEIIGGTITFRPGNTKGTLAELNLPR